MTDEGISEKSVTKDILEILQGKELSISGVTRELQVKGYRFNRLEVTGYLKAMCDMGILKTKVIAPAHVFSLNEG